jgi:hypothetical protein
MRERLAFQVLCVACGCPIHDPDMSALIVVCADCAVAPVLPESDLDPPDYGSRAAVRACPNLRNKRCVKNGEPCLILAAMPSRCADLAPVIDREVIQSRCSRCRTPLRPRKRVRDLSEAETPGTNAGADGPPTPRCHQPGRC